MAEGRTRRGRSPWISPHVAARRDALGTLSRTGGLSVPQPSWAITPTDRRRGRGGSSRGDAISSWHACATRRASRAVEGDPARRRRCPASSRSASASVPNVPAEIVRSGRSLEGRIESQHQQEPARGGLCGPPSQEEASGPPPPRRGPPRPPPHSPRNRRPRCDSQATASSARLRKQIERCDALDHV